MIVNSIEEHDLKRAIPTHIAIIMDGNGRWAKQKGLPRVAGHKRGGDVLKDIVRYAGELQVEHLSVYAFSTENWKRPSQEIKALFKLLVDFCNSQVKELVANRTKLCFIGDIDGMPDKERIAMRSAERATANGDGLQFNVCINYGGRNEIVHAVQAMMQAEVDLQTIDIDTLAQYLYTTGIPDPELIIRTSGEQRLSNFFLWQSAYSEFVFVDDHWPAFTRQHLDACIEQFNRRQRRFGAVKE